MQKSIKNSSETEQSSLNQFKKRILCKVKNSDFSKGETFQFLFFFCKYSKYRQIQINVAKIHRLYLTLMMERQNHNYVTNHNDQFMRFSFAKNSA